MYFKDLEATRHELSVAQGYVKPISEEPQITEMLGSRGPFC